MILGLLYFYFKLIYLKLRYVNIGYYLVNQNNEYTSLCLRRKKKYLFKSDVHCTEMVNNQMIRCEGEFDTANINYPT